MYKLMDAASYSRESELVIMFQKPTHGEKSASRFLAVVDTVGRGGDSRDSTNMG